MTQKYRDCAIGGVLCVCANLFAQAEVSLELSQGTASKASFWRSHLRLRRHIEQLAPSGTSIFSGWTSSGMFWHHAFGHCY